MLEGMGVLVWVNSRHEFVSVDECLVELSSNQNKYWSHDVDIGSHTTGTEVELGTKCAHINGRLRPVLLI